MLTSIGSWSVLDILLLCSALVRCQLENYNPVSISFSNQSGNGDQELEIPALWGPVQLDGRSSAIDRIINFVFAILCWMALLQRQP